VYYDGVMDPALATPVQVHTGQITSGLLLKMAAGGRITGRVLDAQNSAPLPDILIAAYDTAGQWTGYGYSDGDGNYVVPGLATGSYKVVARDLQGIYATQWYRNADTEEQAVPVSVVQGQTVPAVNFSLAFGGSITGTVKDTQGNPLAYMEVFAYPVNGSMVSSYAMTDETGAYRIGGLSTGSYDVGLWLWTGAIIYYPNTADPAHATPVSVQKGRETSGINFVLSTGGSITGTILDRDTGQPASYVEVLVVDGFGMAASWALADENGAYAATWLPAGQYKVMATSGWVAGICYQDAWYNGKSTFEEADWVTVREDSQTTGIDFSLVQIDCSWPPPPGPLLRPGAQPKQAFRGPSVLR
jgi:hypothetical protein